MAFAVGAASNDVQTRRTLYLAQESGTAVSTTDTSATGTSLPVAGQTREEFEAKCSNDYNALLELLRKEEAGIVSEQYLQKYCENDLSRLVEDAVKIADTPSEAISILSGKPASVLLEKLQNVLQFQDDDDVDMMCFWNTSDLVFYQFVRARRPVFIDCENFTEIAIREADLLRIISGAVGPTDDLLRCVDDQMDLAFTELRKNGGWTKREADARLLVCELLWRALSKEQISKKTRLMLGQLFGDVESQAGDFELHLMSVWFLSKLEGREMRNIRQLLLNQIRKAPVSFRKVANTYSIDEVLKMREHVRNYYRTCPLSPRDVLDAASIELGEWLAGPKPKASSQAAACPVERVLLAQMTLEQCCTEDEVKQIEQIYPAMSVEAMVQGMYEGKNGMKFARLVELLHQPQYKKYSGQVKSLTSERKFKHSIDEAARKSLMQKWDEAARKSFFRRMLSYFNTSELAAHCALALRAL
jgi:hypothetical protein